jgi:hypothetical protein
MAYEETTSEKAAPDKKAPARSPEEITRDIAAEREALTAAFDSLSGELQLTADAAAQKAKDIGRKALVVVPAVAAGVGALVAAAALVRRGRRRDG